MDLAQCLVHSKFKYWFLESDWNSFLNIFYSCSDQSMDTKPTDMKGQLYIHCTKFRLFQIIALSVFNKQILSQWISEMFGWVTWHINHCRLFHAKSSLYINTKYIWFGLVGFYGISTIVGYLMPNPLYSYMLNIQDLVRLGFMAYQPS